MDGRGRWVGNAVTERPWRSLGHDSLGHGSLRHGCVWLHAFGTGCGLV